MPSDYPDFPSHRQMLAYFNSYASKFELSPYIRVGTRVSSCRLLPDGRWIVDGSLFDNLVVCSGHHRDPFVPSHPGTFTGALAHSSAYKRADPYRGLRVLVVGAGNSAADIAVDVSRVAAYTAISVRDGTYVVPKRFCGWPVDVVHRFWQGKLPPPVLRLVLKVWLRLAVGAWADYGLPRPSSAPLAKPPTVNSAILAALRDRRVTAVPGIQAYEGRSVHFTDGSCDDFDAVVMATGFRASFPFLPFAVPPLHLNMLHPTIPSLYFIGLFQPIGCIWRLADYQARIAALQITGRLPRSSRWPAVGGIDVDYRSFERQLRRQAGHSCR
jgi:hypothetical protein